MSSSPSLNSFMVNSEIELQLQALLQMEDRASMRYSVETRVPLCTSSILESSYLGSIDWKFHNNLPKGILRDAFSDLIPSHIIERKKKVGRPDLNKFWGSFKSSHSKGIFVSIHGFSRNCESFVIEDNKPILLYDVDDVIRMTNGEKPKW